jgi:hypothetical protein
MATIPIRDGNGVTKYAQVTKGVGTEADPYYLHAVAPITYAAGAQTTVAVGTNTVILAANLNRRGAKIENLGPDNINYWINDTGAYGTGFTLQPGDGYEINNTNLHTAEIRATAQNGTATVVVIEGT